MPQHFISREDAESSFLDAAAYLAESIPPGETRASAIAHVVPYYLEHGNVDLAAELANAVEDPFTRDRLLIAVAAKCAEIDDDEYALQLVEAIEDPGLQAQGYEQVGVAKADKGQFEKAGEVATLMVHPDGIHLRTAIDQAANGDDQAALNTISGIQFPRDAVMAFNAIVAGKIKDGNPATAAEILSLAEAKAAEIEHDEERIRSYCEIGNLFIDAEQKGRSVQIFDTARNDAEELDNAHRDPLLANVAIGFLNAGSVDLADRTLDAVTDKTQVATVVLAFARDHWRKEEKDEAIEALEEAFAILRSQHETETRDSRAKFILMGTIAAQFAGFQKCERAIEAADVIPDEDHKNNAYSQIAQIAVTQGEFQFAEQALNEIRGELDRLLTIIGMSRAALDAGDTKKALELLTDAAAAISTLQEPTARFTAITEMSKVYFANGDVEKSGTFFDNAISELNAVRNSNFKVSGLAELSKMLEEFEFEMTDERTDGLRKFL